MTELELHAQGIGAGLQRALAFLAERPRTIAAIWGVLIAAGAIAHVGAQAPKPLLPVRAQAIASSIAVLDRGGPPLLASDVPYAKGVPAGRLARLGEGSDAGSSLYLPMLGHLTGSSDPAVLMKWVFAACLGLLVLVLPLVAFELFGSLLFAFLAPILVLWQFEGMGTKDVYWVEAWCQLLCLPLLLLGLRWWRNGLRHRAGSLLGVLALVAGLASSLRSDAGLAIIVDGVAIVLVGDVRRLRVPAIRLGRPGRATVTRLGLAAALVLAYLCASTFALDAAAAYRDSAVHMPPSGSGTPHRPVADIALGGLVGDALRRFWLAPMLLAVGLALPRRRRDAALAAALVAPALLLGSTRLLVVPETRYAFGWLGAWGVLWLLGIGWTLAELVDLLRRGELRARLTATRLRSRGATGVGLVVVAVAAATAAGAPAPARSTETFYSKRDTPYGLAPVNVVGVADWRFGGTLPSGWQARAGAELRPDSSADGRLGLFVKARGGPGAAVLRGPALLLPAGRYVVEATGLVLGGGIALRASDDRGAILGRSRHWWFQRNVRGLPLTTRFRLPRPTRVALSVRDWARAPSSTAFSLRTVSLLRVSPNARFYAPRATPVTPRSALTGKTVQAWPFSGGTPNGVAPEGENVRNIGIPNGLRVNTTRTPSAYQIVVEPVALEPGRYLVALDGRVFVGGLALELLDATTGTPIGTWHFWYGQRFRRRAMAGTVTLHTRRTVRIVLANWSPEPISSMWGLRALGLQQLP